LTILVFLSLRVVAEPADVDARLTGFVARTAYEHADAAYQQRDAAYQYAHRAYFHRDATEFVRAAVHADRDDEDGVRCGPEIVRAIQRVLYDASDERADDQEMISRDAIVTSDGQELSADCINVLSDDAEEQRDCIDA